MTGFGSLNFGQTSFGINYRLTAVDEVQTVSTMLAHGVLTHAGRLENRAVTNMDVASGLLQGANLNPTATATMIASSIKMIWHPSLPVTAAIANMDVNAKLVWDGQTIPVTTWTTQIVGD